VSPDVSDLRTHDGVTPAADQTAIDGFRPDAVVCGEMPLIAAPVTRR